MQKKIGSVLTRSGKVLQANIIGKNENFYDIPSAENYYNKKRLNELGRSFFSVKYYHPEFISILTSLMKFQNPVSMNVWHDRSIVIKDENTGFVMSTTWDNLCTCERPFTIAEMYTCLEIIKRATPNECLYVFEKDFLESGLSPLKFFNEIAYPIIMSVVSSMEEDLLAMDEQISKPIRDKINCDLKIMAKIPLSEEVEFITKKVAR